MQMCLTSLSGLWLSELVVSIGPHHLTLSPLHLLPLVRRTHLVGLVVRFHTEQAAFPLPVWNGLTQRKGNGFSEAGKVFDPHSGQVVHVSSPTSTTQLLSSWISPRLSFRSSLT